MGAAMVGTGNFIASREPYRPCHTAVVAGAIRTTIRLRTRSGADIGTSMASAGRAVEALSGMGTGVGGLGRGGAPSTFEMMVPRHQPRRVKISPLDSFWCRPAVEVRGDETLT